MAKQSITQDAMLNNVLSRRECSALFENPCEYPPFRLVAKERSVETLCWKSIRNALLSLLHMI